MSTQHAADQPCWYANAAHRPMVSRCPATCNGATSHAERLADGHQQFYCEAHAHWRATEVGRQHLRTLEADELV